MVKPQLQDSYDPITEADLERFEDNLGARLPEDYRDFLVKYNGGFFPPFVSYRDTMVVAQLYGLLPEDEISDGLYVTNRRLDLRKGLVAIGSADCGDQICIVVSGRDIGSIWWRCHESGWHEEGDGREWPPANHERISDTFSSFFEGISYDSDAEWNEAIPEFLVAEQGDAEALGHLLNAGFDMESRNDRDQTLLICAAHNRQSQVVKMLLEHGANVESRDSDGCTALIWAARSYSLDSIKLLVAAGADIEATDNEGNTPLLASLPDGKRAALYLISHGANVNAMNNEGHRPLQYCMDYGAEKLWSALIASGADVSLVDNPIPKERLELLDSRDIEDFDDELGD
jgi:hypothetical protein